MTLYGIWYADYSNSYVGDAVYTSRDDADAVARASNGDIVEFEVDPPLNKKTHKLRRPGERFYHTAMNCNGHKAQAWDSYPSELHPAEDMSVRVNKGGEVERFNVACWAEDEKHAIKIANDRRTQWIAAGGLFSKEPQITHGHDYGWRKALT